MVGRLLLALALLVVVPLVGLPAWIALNRGDLPEVDDADLRIEVPELAEEDDAYVWFRRAVEAMVWNDSTKSHERLRAIQAGEISDPEWIADMTAINARSFLLLEAGLEAPGARIPPWTPTDLDDPGSTFEVLLPLQILVRLSALDARRVALEGDVAGSLDRVLLGMRVGRKLSEAADPQLLTLIMVGAFQGISLGETERLLPQIALSPAEARSVADRLEAMRWDPDSWRRMWAIEYANTKALLQAGMEDVEQEEPPTWDREGLARKALWNLPSDYVFQLNRSLSMLADGYRHASAGSQQTCRAIRPDDAEPSEWPTLRILVTPNSSGRMMLDLVSPNLFRFDLRRCRLASRISLVQALLALHAYRNERGHLPAQLEDLVPDYLDAVPKDRFDGEPIRWSREQATVYSLGSDFEDEGPPESPSQIDDDAPAVRLPTAS